jgi:hypothetical protein
MAKVANFSGINALADSIKDNRAISLVNMSSIQLGRDGALSICDGLLRRYYAFW